MEIPRPQQNVSIPNQEPAMAIPTPEKIGNGIFSKNPSFIWGFVILIVVSVIPLIISANRFNGAIIIGGGFSLFGSLVTGILEGLLIWAVARLFKARIANFSHGIMIASLLLLFNMILTLVSIRFGIFGFGMILDVFVFYFLARYYFNTSIVRTIFLTLAIIVINALVIAAFLFVIFRGFFGGGW